MIQQRIQALLATSKQGKVLREGLSTAIIGRPNVGKSSLLNHLLREEKQSLRILQERLEM